LFLTQPDSKHFQLSCKHVIGEGVSFELIVHIQTELLKYLENIHQHQLFTSCEWHYLEGQGCEFSSHGADQFRVGVQLHVQVVFVQVIAQ